MSQQLATGFKSVVDFKTPRPPLMALAFYAFHAVICVLLGMLTGMIAGSLFAPNTGSDLTDFERIAEHTAEIEALIYSTALYAAVVWARGKLKVPLYMIGIAAVFLIALCGGAMLGVIPSAVTLAIKPETDGKKKP